MTGKKNSKRDYEKIVEQAADEVHATVHDLASPEALFAGGLGMVIRQLDTTDRELAAWSDVASRKVFVAMPLKSELGATIAMHELGHVVLSGVGDDYLQNADDEARASGWALDHLPFVIGSGTATQMMAALKSYDKAIYGADTCNTCTEIKTDSVAWKLEQRLLGLGADDHAVFGVDRPALSDLDA